MTILLAQAHSVSVQASSFSAQAKAALPQVGDRNWNWRKNLLCPTIEGVLLGERGSWENRPSRAWLWGE